MFESASVEEKRSAATEAVVMTEGAGAKQDIAGDVVRAASEGLSDGEKATLAERLYKEATGRFPVDSGDRRTVYQWGIVAAVALAMVTSLIIWGMSETGNGPATDGVLVLGSAVTGGIVGGLFGYSRQSS